MLGLGAIYLCSCISICWSAVSMFNRDNQCRLILILAGHDWSARLAISVPFNHSTWTIAGSTMIAGIPPGLACKGDLMLRIMNICMVLLEDVICDILDNSKCKNLSLFDLTLLSSATGYHDSPVKFQRYQCEAIAVLVIAGRDVGWVGWLAGPQAFLMLPGGHYWGVHRGG